MKRAFAVGSASLASAQAPRKDEPKKDEPKKDEPFVDRQLEVAHDVLLGQVLAVERQAAGK